MYNSRSVAWHALRVRSPSVFAEVLRRVVSVLEVKGEGKVMEGKAPGKGTRDLGR